MSEIKEIAQRLFKARLASTEAKAKLKEYRVDAGSCIHPKAGQRGPCYIHKDIQDDWCPVCQASEPLHQVRKKTATEAGAALRALMAACRRSA